MKISDMWACSLPSCRRFCVAVSLSRLAVVFVVSLLCLLAAFAALTSVAFRLLAAFVALASVAFRFLAAVVALTAVALAAIALASVALLTFFFACFLAFLTLFLVFLAAALSVLRRALHAYSCLGCGYCDGLVVLGLKC